MHATFYSAQGFEERQKELLTCCLEKPGQTMSSYLLIFWATHLSGCAGLLYPCCYYDLAITCIKAEITSGIPEEAEGPQWSMR